MGGYAFRYQGLSAEAQHRLRPAQECGGAVGVQRQPAQRRGDQANFAAPALDRDVDRDVQFDLRIFGPLFELSGEDEVSP